MAMTEDFDREMGDMSTYAAAVESIGVEKGIGIGIEKGIGIGVEKGRIEMCVDSLRNLIRTQHWSAEEAMDMIGVPEEYRERVEGLLAGAEEQQV